MNNGPWNLGEWLSENGSPNQARAFFGVVPAYPIFMLVGILLVLAIAAYQLKKRGILLNELYLGIWIVIPVGLVGATMFGKMFLPYYQQSFTWYRIFFFWEPGMSLFGCLMFGSFAGFTFYYFRSKKTQISVWVFADCIIPHILIGQALGRWGNFYNHEILGAETTWGQLSYLPDSIRSQLFYFPPIESFYIETQSGWLNANDINFADVLKDADSFVYWGPELQYNTVPLIEGQTKLSKVLEENIIFHQPLFLFESIANIILWIFIVFAVQNLGKWLTKPKPWDLQPNAYPGWFNKQLKHLPEMDVISTKTIAPIKYKNVKITNNGDVYEIKMSLKQAWNKAFYYYEPDEESQYQLQKLETQHFIHIDEVNQQLKRTRQIYRQKRKNLGGFWAYLTNPAIRIKYDKIVEEHEKTILLIYKQEGTWSRWLRMNCEVSSQLDKLNNLNGFKIIRSGVLTGVYLTGYMIIRICLESMRKPEEYFIQNSVVADFLVLSLLLVSAIYLIIHTQWIAPRIWREVGWLYEKSY